MIELVLEWWNLATREARFFTLVWLTFPFLAIALAWLAERADHTTERRITR